MLYYIPGQLWIEKNCFRGYFFFQDIYVIYVWNWNYILLAVLVLGQNFLEVEFRYWSNDVFGSSDKEHIVWFIFYGDSIQIRNSFWGIHTDFDNIAAVGRSKKSTKNQLYITISEIIIRADNGLDRILFDFQHNHDIYGIEHMGYLNIWILKLCWLNADRFDDLLGENRPLAAFENKSVCFFHVLADLLVSRDIYVAFGVQDHSKK
jgi:hypothetical protein